MRKLLLAAAVLGTFCAQAEDLLAFPEAAGWGRYAKGARASSAPTVVHVTNLNDSGTGSLRAAVTSPNRIVVFDVSGVIKISSTIVFSSNLYVAGQTAPGEGITVYGDRCSFSGASNIICRYLRWRMGAIGSNGKDCAGIANGTNMIFDHCSFSWGQDETFSINPDGKGDLGHITLQNCIFGQGLLTHSAGGLMQADYITLYRNLYCDNSTRNNKVKGINEYANNIVYNWKNGCYIMGGDSSGQSYANIEGNLFINGPSSGDSNALGGGNSYFHFYGNDNWQDKDRDGTFDPSCIDSSQTGGGDKVSTRYAYSDLELYAGNELLTKNLPTVGASLPYRDQSDCYMVDEVMSCGADGNLIANESSLPIGVPSSWTWWAGTTRTDTDKDGMPDDWETANGTNPSSDDATSVAANGYLNIENYINSITAANRQFFLRAPILPTRADATTTTITLSWRDYTYGEAGFAVQYRVSGSTGSYTTGPSTSSNATSVVITGLAEATIYEIRVRAFGPNLSGTTEYSDWATLTAATRASEGTLDIDTYEPDVTWKTGLSTWDKTSTGWKEGVAYADGDKVLLENNGSGSPTLTISESVSPDSVVVKGSGYFTLAGNGNLAGTCSLNKAGSGLLFLTGNNTFTGAVVNHGGTISFDTLANKGVASPLGASGGMAERWVFDGGTYRYTGGSVSCDRSAKLLSDSTFLIKNSAATVTMSGKFEGSGGLTLDGEGTLSIADSGFFAYTNAATTIKGGTLYLSTTGPTGSANTFNPSSLVLAGGTVKFAYANEDYQTHTFPIYAQSGTTSYMSLPSHGYLTGAIHGDAGATIQMNIPYCREYVKSSWSDYSGEIIANGSGSSSVFLPGGSWNATKVRFNLTGTVHMGGYTTNAENYLGGLSGDAGTYLIGSSKNTGNFKCSWTIGSANSDETFAGIINNKAYNLSTDGTTSITKVGTGDWRLTGQNVYSGTTTINGGRLFVNAAHSGTGAWIVNDGGTLRGTNKITGGGSVTVNSGGTLNPGDDGSSSSLTIYGTTTFKSGSTLKISGSSFWQQGSCTIQSGATLEIDPTAYGLTGGASIRVFKGPGAISGTFSTIEPTDLGENLVWDTTDLYTTNGLLKVKKVVPSTTTWIGADGAYWDQESSWDGGIPDESQTAVFTNKNTLTVSMGWNSDACVCAAIQLKGGDVKFYPRKYWPRLSPKSVTGKGTLYLLAASNTIDGSGTTAVGLESPSDSDTVVEVPVVVATDSATTIWQDVFLQGLNGHTVTFMQPVTVESTGKLFSYGNVIFRGGLEIASTKGNSLRGYNTIASALTGAGTLYLETTAGTTTFSGDNSGFTGTITQNLYNNVPYFVGGAAAPANATVNINGDMRLIANTTGETFRFGALNLTPGAWNYGYISKGMDVTVEVGSKGDCTWDSGYCFGSLDGSTASTAIPADAKIVKVGSSTFRNYAKGYAATNLVLKGGVTYHPQWTMDFEDTNTWSKGWSLGGNGGSASASRVKKSGATSNFLHFWTGDGSGDRDYYAQYDLPTAVTSAKDYTLEFDWFASNNVLYNGSSIDLGLYVYAGSALLFKIISNPQTLATGANVLVDDTTNAVAILTAATPRVYSGDTEGYCTDSYHQDCWYHIVISGNATKGTTLKIYNASLGTLALTETRLCDFTNVTRIKDDHNKKRSNFSAYGGFDDFVCSLADAVPSIDGDTGAILTGDATAGFVLTPSEGVANVVVSIPSGVDASKVTVRVPSTASTVTANGATVKIVKGDNDITDYLDVPAAVDGVVDVAAAEVKQTVADETLDPDEGAAISLDPDAPSITTAATKKGLDYQLQEGHTIPEMKADTTGDATTGDGSPWTPNITVKGGESGFYRIKVSR